MVSRKEQKYEFWIDKVARDVVEREKKLKRDIKTIRVEMGIGASGIPHIGSASDGVRAYGVKLGIENIGGKSELIAYSDTYDGLRKVPSGLPSWLEEHIGEPVINIPDPFDDGHKNFAEHMSSLLIDGFERLGMKFVFMSGADVYKKGLLNEQVEKILMNAGKVGEITKKLTGQEKFLQVLPYFPVCEACGKIYTTRAYKLLSGHKVAYKCDQEFVGKNATSGKEIVVKGCGHEGEVSYFNGTGKLSWKSEFAARWTALKISFEAYGKDIADSVKVNDLICKEILGFEPPLHIKYELFLQKGGRKISKSIGNVFTPQVWLRYGTPQSLILLMLKRFEGARELDVTDIPKYMNEVDSLEKIYFGIKKINDIRELTNSKRLFEYINFLKPPKKTTVHAPFNVMVEVAKISPEKNQLQFAIEKLKDFGYVKEKLSLANQKEIESYLQFAKQWVTDFVPKVELEIKVESQIGRHRPDFIIYEKGIPQLIVEIKRAKNEEELQKKIFEIAKNLKIPQKEFFKSLYIILLKSEKGPRLGTYIITIGKEEITKKLEDALKRLK